MTQFVAPAESEHYLHRSRRALQSHCLLAPMLLLYEIGMAVHDPTAGNGSVSIKARSLLINFLTEFGWAGRYLAPVMVVVILVSLHVMRREPWRLDWRLYLAMAAEAVAEAIPLLMFALVWGQQIATDLVVRQLAAAAGAGESWFVGIVTALGAGVYEELVFRLIAITVLHFVLVDLLGLQRLTGAALAIGCAAVLFSAYHFTTPANPFTWPRFAFFALAGGYLGVVYLARGFGIVAAVHAFYNIFCVIVAKTE
jgi:membrane protease YdiL (CAAX protease family)